MSSVSSRPSLTELRIEVESTDASATISANEHTKSIEIIVRRFKNENVLCLGSWVADQEVDRMLGLLCTELAASPFG